MTAWGSVQEGAGLALRCPRFTGGYRDDKGPADATTVTEISELYERASRPPSKG
jgi:DNA ligase-1